MTMTILRNKAKFVVSELRQSPISLVELESLLSLESKGYNRKSVIAEIQAQINKRNRAEVQVFSPNTNVFVSLDPGKSTWLPSVVTASTASRVDVITSQGLEYKELSIGQVVRNPYSSNHSAQINEDISVSNVPHARMSRLVRIIRLLKSGRCSPKEIAAIIGNISTRSVFRYLHTIRELVALEKDVFGRYYVPSNKCPLCDKEAQGHPLQSNQHLH